uniref:Atp-dependent dna helicase ddm1-like n=1 Tax=Tetraselmis sp. GSL018 TaxID=582737 RepID=A0A061RSK4_9CHLO
MSPTKRPQEDVLTAKPEVSGKDKSGIKDIETSKLSEMKKGAADKVSRNEEGSSDDDLDWAPSDLAAEEKALADERRKNEGQAPEVEALLEDFKFKQLDQLLHRTGLFTQFLSEQMQEISKQTEAEEESARKRRLSGQGAAGSQKRQRIEGAQESEEAVQTKDLLPLMTVSLREYQLTGVKWLISLYKNGLNGILADQMGLGKTVQTIGFLSHLRHKGIMGPFLVIGPLSTLPNWVDEIERFCPSMPVVLYHGSADERAEIRRKRMPRGAKVTQSFPVCVTSYEIIIRDVKHLQKYQWKYVVVDEGHRLKNFDCKLLRELRQIPAANKLLLTGTPLQNNLAELWSLLNFILPDVFCSLSDFESWFDFSTVGKEGGDKALLAQQQRNQVITKLHSLLRPFMLRRIKSDVEIGLPGKMEVVMYAEMTPLQKDLNRKLLDKSLLSDLSEKARSDGVPRSMLGTINNLVMQLRKNANHPDLITAAFDNSVTYPSSDELKQQCGKLQLLDRLLTKLFAGGHKVLIFSQMTKMLDLLDHYLEESGVRAARIDGSVQWEDRKRWIKDFNSDPDLKVFLLSTRAGGLGVNLTAADTVIIYDSDWNPHQDLQAMDRVHRIGQTRPVIVIRLATAHSVEGKMLSRAGSKMALERVVIKKGAFKGDNDLQSDPTKESGNMKAEELLELLKADYDSVGGVSQSGVISDEMLDQVLDRKFVDKPNLCPYPNEGVGYSIVMQNTGSGQGLLAGVNTKAGNAENE